MQLTIKVNPCQLMAICWEAKRNIHSEIDEDTEGTMGYISAKLLDEGLNRPFCVIGSQGSWIRGSESYLTSVAVDVMANNELVLLTVIPG